MYLLRVTVSLLTWAILLVAPAIAATGATGNGSTPLSISPISGTVTANQGTSPWVNNITQFGSSAFTLGTSSIGSSLSVTPATSAVFPVSGTFFQAIQPISGTVTATQGTSPWIVTTPPPTTTVTVTQATGTNLHAVLDAGAAIIGSIANTTFTVTQATGTNLHAVLDAGAALIGKVGFDQTTPGTTNLVNARVCDTTATTKCAAVSNGGGFLSVGAFVDGGGAIFQPIACSSSTAVNISTATTTTLVAVSGVTVVRVCSYSLYVVSGTLPSFKFVYGTGAACVTGQTALTGTYGGIAGAIGQLFNIADGLGTIFQAPAANGLCLVSAGTLPNIQGVITYSQF